MVHHRWYVRHVTFNRSAHRAIMPTSQATTEATARTIADLLAAQAPLSSRQLAEALKASPDTVRDLLSQMERRGIVYRTGHTRGTRWWLG